MGKIVLGDAGKLSELQPRIKVWDMTPTYCRCKLPFLLIKLLFAKSTPLMPEFS